MGGVTGKGGVTAYVIAFEPRKIATKVIM